MTLIMDSPRLRELTRTQLQSLAKREVIRAVGKTEDIIRRLVRKHPRGVPVPEDDDNPSASLAPLKQNVPKKYHKSTSPPPETSKARTDPQGESKPVAEAISLSPSSSTEALEQLLYPEDEPLAGPSNSNPESASVPHPEVTESEADHPQSEPAPPSEPRNEDSRNAASPLEAQNSDWQAGEEEEFDNIDYPKGAPTHYMVVDTLRQFTTLVDTIPSMKTRVAESRCLLQRTKTLLEKATPDARELAVTREYLETFLLAKMKQKRELWDGTAKMKKEPRKFRMEWLKAERRAENERRWREANELNKKCGLEPFSAFVSESDEETIESLQTTPASSRSGSPKRPREESVDAEFGEDAGADDESQRKRARS